MEARFRYALTACGCAAALFLVESFALDRLAAWGERDRGSYPYIAGEDPMRLLLPSMFGGPGDSTALILGPSAAHEGILYEEVARAFPEKRVLSMGLSTGTMDDNLVALELIEKLHGPDAVPRTLILGVSYRDFANVPRRFGDRRDPTAYAPLLEVVRRYSPFSPVAGPHFTSLVEKGVAGKVKAAFTFRLKKQQPRYRTAMAALIGAIIGDLPLKALDDVPWPNVEEQRDVIGPDNIVATANAIADLGPIDALRAWLTLYRTPYYTAFVTTTPKAKLLERMRTRGWRKKQDWTDDEAFVPEQFGRLQSTCKRLGIRLYVVKLPENPITFPMFPAGTKERYGELLRQNTKGVPFFDQHTALREDEFMDDIHPLHPVARRMSKRIVDFIRTSTEAGWH